MDSPNSEEYQALFSDDNPSFRRSSKQSECGRTRSRHLDSGLTFEEGLIKLHQDIEFEIYRMKLELSKRNFFSWMRESLSFRSELSKMRWPSVLFMVAHVIAHFVVEFVLNVDRMATEWVGFQGFILTCLLVLNISVNLWDTKLRSKELLMKSENLSKMVKQCSEDKHLLRKWRSQNCPSDEVETLFVPNSPSVHRTLTYRDKTCSNLADFLLVRGDIIHLFPGERSPGHCVSLLKDSDIDAERVVLQDGQMYRPRITDNSKRDVTDFTSQQYVTTDPRMQSFLQSKHVKLKRATQGTDFMMLSTPYIKSLRLSLQRSLKRPVNSVEKECFTISRKYFETFVIPLVYTLSTIVTAIHYGYLDLTDSDHEIKTISIAYLLMRPSLTIMPFLPWVFPCLWMLVNAYGSARLLCCSNLQRRLVQTEPRGSSDLLVRGQQVDGRLNKMENLLSTPTAPSSSACKHDEDDLHDISVNIPLVSIFPTCLELIRGKGGHVWRSSSLLQVLGCLTSLCCIDKVGILSWPNPTPEKVLIMPESSQTPLIVPFMTNHSEENVHEHDNEGVGQQLSGQYQLPPDNHNVQVDSYTLNPSIRGSSNFLSPPSKRTSNGHHKPEILDVSINLGSYREIKSSSGYVWHDNLQFDDLNWQKYLNCLKPLGMTILLNNCCTKSFNDYFRFYKHISYESFIRCKQTPVVKRRCMCGLSRLIGFTKSAVENHRFKKQMGLYRVTNPNSSKTDKLTSSFGSTNKLKFPFPNMTCNIHQDTITGCYQIFSQGTADILLNVCNEFWDGKNLIPLDDSTRKKIMDFHQRTSLTAYCTAFSYASIIEAPKIGSYYIELSNENSRFDPSIKKFRGGYLDNFVHNRLNLFPRISKPMDEAVKVEASDREVKFASSIQYDGWNQPKPRDKKVETKQAVRRNLSVENITDLLRAESPRIDEEDKGENRSHRLSNLLDDINDQVFVGMISTQYQACPDFVVLVEQLEHACIRFIHFSKENELRSRVFSEKMGLESGWNCHISLQSENDSVKDSREGIFEAIEELDLSEARSRDSQHLSRKLANSFYDSSEQDVSDQSSISSENTLYSWKSLPSMVMKLSAKLFNDRIQHLSVRKADAKDTQSADDRISSEAAQMESVEVTDLNSDSQSSSKEEEEAGFETLAFDMSNRAKLPKGIENIRPHLETVDNVPLQVSLFTDCTPNLTREMIEIMQHYGEIVCILGSSSSVLNTSVFLQANASIGIEPLKPDICSHANMMTNQRSKQPKKHKVGKDSKQDVNSPPARATNKPRDRLGMAKDAVSEADDRPIKVIARRNTAESSTSSSSFTSDSSKSSSSSKSTSSNSRKSSALIDGQGYDSSSSEGDKEDHQDSLVHILPSPNALASKLASLPCSYNYDRNDPFNLYSLIMEARHFTFKMKNTFVCMLCFALSISSAQFLASLLFLPPMFSSGLTIWLTIIVVPLLSFALMSTTMDSQVMKIAVGKNLQLKPENIRFFVTCYLIKFIPSIIVVVLSFGLIIAHSCKLTGFGSSSLGPCWMFTYVRRGNTTSPDVDSGDLLWSSHLLTAQVSAAFLTVLYFGK